MPIYAPAYCVFLIQSVKAADPPETIVPVANPTASEYTIKAGVDLASFKQKITIPVVIPPIVSTFRRPNWSASIPGIMRPKVEAALRIASRYEASVAFIPRVTAYVGTKNSGSYMPTSMKNTAAIMRIYRESLNADPTKKLVFQTAPFEA